MLVHLAMMLSTSNGWVIAPDDKAHDSSPLAAHDSAITGEVDGGHARRQLASGCSGSWSACPHTEPSLAHQNRVCVTRVAFLLAAMRTRARIRVAAAPAVTMPATPAAARAATAGATTAVTATVTGLTPPATAAVTAAATAAVTAVPPAATPAVIPVTPAGSTMTATPAAPPAVPPVRMASTAPQARHSLAPPSRRGRAAKPAHDRHRVCHPHHTPPHRMHGPTLTRHSSRCTACARRPGAAHLQF